MISRMIAVCADTPERAKLLSDTGADEIVYYNEAAGRENIEDTVRAVKVIRGVIDTPIAVYSSIERFEDVKKLLYAGASRVFISCSDMDTVREAAGRFGADEVGAYIPEVISASELTGVLSGYKDAGVEHFVLGLADVSAAADICEKFADCTFEVLTDMTDTAVLSKLLSPDNVSGVMISADDLGDVMQLKQQLRGTVDGLNLFESSISFDEFKTDAAGLVPCIAQDYKTGEVLMLAYMSKESFDKTIDTGRMTYYSRSRQKLWTKGEESGHFQFVKSLTIDCDKDTILAKVAQIGPACHTGNPTCFFTPLVEKETYGANPMSVFEDVYSVIKHRKEHPKEGSYTNYLFDKGIDKILKKVGEECTEIVIAAKNPDPEEIKYEIADYMYHLMVLMAERGVTWKDITDELADREKVDN